LHYIETFYLAIAKLQMYIYFILSATSVH